MRNQEAEIPGVEPLVSGDVLYGEQAGNDGPSPQSWENLRKLARQQYRDYLTEEVRSALMNGVESDTVGLDIERADRFLEEHGFEPNPHTLILSARNRKQLKGVRRELRETVLAGREARSAAPITPTSWMRFVFGGFHSPEADMTTVYRGKRERRFGPAATEGTYVHEQIHAGRATKRHRREEKPSFGTLVEEMIARYMQHSYLREALGDRGLHPGDRDWVEFTEKIDGERRQYHLPAHYCRRYLGEDFGEQGGYALELLIAARPELEDLMCTPHNTPETFACARDVIESIKPGLFPGLQRLRYFDGKKALMMIRDAVAEDFLRTA